MKKHLILFILFLILPITIFSKDLKKVSLQLSWFDQFQFAGYYMAKEKGYYKEYGLDVEIKPFSFGLDIPKLVSDGKIDFAVGRETLILERTKNRKIVALYSLFQASPLVLLSTKESGINKIEDFRNKKIMTTIDDAHEVSLKAMITSQKIKVDKLTFLKHSHNINDLIDKKTDLISAYLSKSPYELQQKAIEYNVFDPKKYGFDMYSDFLFTSESLIDRDFETVENFRNASLKGWQYAYDNIEESTNLILDKYNVQFLNKEQLMFEGKELKKLSYFNTSDLGNIKREKVQRIYDLYNVMGLLPSSVDISKFIYDEIKKDKHKIKFSERHLEYMEKHKIISMCVIPNVKPYSYIEDGKLNGLVSDYLKLIKEDVPTSFSLVETKSLAQSVEYLKNKKCDILLSAEATNSRKKFANFTKPYLDVPLVLITDSHTTFIEDLKVLKNKKIGLVKSYSLNKTIRTLYPQLTFVDVENLDEGINKVLDGKLDGHIDLMYTSWYKIYSKNLFDLRISAKLDFMVPISIAIQKDDLILYEILNIAVNNIDMDRKEKLIKKWVTVEYKKEFDYMTLWKFIFVFIVILLAIVYKQIILRKMNKTLKQKIDEKTLELQIINNNLEERVNLEVSENLRKDALLTKQSKLAAMGEMIQNIAHQWRQPLSIISTGASGLKVQKEINGKIEDKLLDETLSTIVDTSVNLSRTIDDFMNFFKPSKERTLISIENSIDKTLNIFDYNRYEGKIKIIKKIENIKITGYESEFIQIIMNILNNSKEAFIESKEEEKLIFIDVEKKKKNLFIKIKDNAGGISEEILPRVFEPYFTTKHQYSGTGIGLYMCQKMLEKHMNGIMDIENISFVYKGKKYKGTLSTIKLELD